MAAQIDQDILITTSQLKARFSGISEMTLWRWLRHPTMNFPKPIFIRRRKYWREYEIKAWLEVQVARLDKAA